MTVPTHGLLSDTVTTYQMYSWVQMLPLDPTDFLQKPWQFYCHPVILLFLHVYFQSNANTELFILTPTGRISEAKKYLHTPGDVKRYIQKLKAAF